MSESIQIPAVATKHYALCKKCETDRYHTVLTHPTATSVKMKCEVCGKTSTISFLSPEKRKKAAVQRLAGAAATKRAHAENVRKTQYQTEYDKFMSQGAAPVAKYNMKAIFAVNSKLDHPKFGMGFVRGAQIDKIEVVFSDEVRLLIHNRP